MAGPLTDTQIIVAMMRLTAHLDDGHAGISLPDGDSEFVRLVRLEFFLFADGLHVTAAGPGYTRLLGARVEAIGGRAVGEVIAALGPLIARDNDQQVTLMVPLLLRQTAILHGLGLTGDLGQVTLTVRHPDGSAREEAVEAVPGRPFRGVRSTSPNPQACRACYPGLMGGPWLCRTLVLSLFHAVVVPSGLSTRVQPHR